MTTDPSPAVDLHADHIWARRAEQLYGARLSVLYHLKRAAFFDRIDKVASAATAVAATAAVGAVLKAYPDADKWTAIATACLSLVPLVFSPAQRSYKHTDLAGQFRRLVGAMESAGEHWTQAQCDAFAGQFAELEAGEPAPLGALVAECQNQLSLAVPVDRRAPIIKLTVWQRFMKHWIDFDAASLAAR